MSGGRLVVLDRLGRDVKRFPLREGLATLGSSPACDIRVMLPDVAPHHATVVTHNHQTVVRNVGDGETIVNGRPVSVAALRHADVITLGDRSLRWEYDDPAARRHLAAEPALHQSKRAARGLRRGSGAAPPPPRDRALQLALELRHRASMPGSAGGKQVAIVQPQRRDTNDQIESGPARGTPQPKRPRASKSEADSPPAEEPARKSSLRTSPKTLSLQNTTKATLWIESRKSSPRKSSRAQPAPPRRALSAKRATPLRLTVLKRVQSAHKARVAKIEAPSEIDPTKQAAIMLMTGHTPRAFSAALKKSPATPSYVIKKPSPVRRTPRGRPAPRRSKVAGDSGTPRRASTFEKSTRSKRSSAGDQSVSPSVLEITDSETQTSLPSQGSRRSRQKSSLKSPQLASPKKSAMKDPSAKRSTRKTESIKFDLSNLEGHSNSNLLTPTGVTKGAGDSGSEDEMTLHYSESSNQSPSPRQSIHSRSSRILGRLGEAVTSSPDRTSRTLTPLASPARKSLRGSLMVSKVLDTSGESRSSRTSDATVASAFRTRTLSPRASNQNMESYSIVDLVSLDSDGTSRSSVYNSAGSFITAFGTPQETVGRKTRSTINASALGTSTPYVGSDTSRPSRGRRSRSNPTVAKKPSRPSVSTRRSKSMTELDNTTPENASKISVNSTRVSRASKSRSRINDSDLLLLDDEDDSPKTSKRSRPSRASKASPGTGKVVEPASHESGTVTPENRHSPEEASTPMLSIKNLLDLSQSSIASRSSKRGRSTVDRKRKTIAVPLEAKKGKLDVRSKSLGHSARKTRLRLSKDSSEVSDKTDEGAPQPDSEDTVTPKSAAKPVPEAVKNKHSTAKKTQSKRSMIDDLNRSDIVKELFSSPVKRKLSQSMTEFSRKQLFDDEEDTARSRRPTRNTIAVAGRTPDDSFADDTEAITPERFVSPLVSAGNSPNVSGLRRLFKKTSPDNDLRDVRGVRGLFRTPRQKKAATSPKNPGVKLLFARSPRNRLSDVRVKETFAASPRNDLRRVTGVNALFRARSPQNDLRNVHGVKKLFKRKSPDNDLTDVRGVKQMFRERKRRTDFTDVSGIEELFNESGTSQEESLFDRLVGRPTIKAVYSKTFTVKGKKQTSRKTKSLHDSIDDITNNVEEWLQQELQRRLNKEVEVSSSSSKSRSSSRNVSRNTSRMLHHLATDTLQGSAPMLESRTRNSTFNNTDDRKKSASELYGEHTLPIKKRSFVNTSLNRSRKLPIKKRAVVHSTPVKGRAGLLNASALGRVSPIAPVDLSAGSLRPAQTTNILSDSKSTTRSPRARASVKKISIVKSASVQETSATNKTAPSPNNIRSKEPTPVKPRTTRNRQSKIDIETKNTKKKRASLVITKKAPVLSPKRATRRGQKDPVQNPKTGESPKPAPKTRRQKPESPKNKAQTKQAPSPKTKQAESPKALAASSKTKKAVTPKAKEAESPKPSPKKTRATRATREGIQRTPKKNTRTKVQKGSVSVVIGKPSPKLKPQPKAAPVKAASLELRGRRSRKVTEKESPKESPKIATVPKGRGRKTQNQSKQDSVVEKPQARRTRRTEPESEDMTRGRKANIPASKEEKPKRGQKAKDSPKPAPPKRGQKAVSESEVTEIKKPSRARKVTEPAEDKPQAKRGRNAAATPEKPQPKRGRKTTASESKSASSEASQETVQPEPRARRGRTNESVPETKGRKRKSTATEELPSKIAKTERNTRGRKTVVDTKEEATAKRSKSKAKASDADVAESEVNKTTRGGRAKKVEAKEKNVEKESEEAPRATRGKKAAVSNSVDDSKTGRLKRKPAAEASPSPAKGKKPPAAKKARAAATSPAAGRTTRAKNDATVIAKPATGRARRR